MWTQRLNLRRVADRSARRWLPAAFVAFLFTVWQLVLGPGPIWADTVQYIRIALSFQGISADAAWHTAYSQWCLHPSVPHHTPQEVCVRQVGSGQQPIIGVSDRNSQYQAIFSPRIGYPLLSLPFMQLFGIHVGMWILPLALTALSGLVVYVLAKMLGMSAPGALAAQILFYVLPIGQHNVALLSEGPAVFAILLVLVGAVCIVQNRVRRGVGLTGVGYVLLFAFKYSSVLLTAVSLTAIVLMMLLRPTFRSNRRLRLVGALSAGCGALGLALSALLHLPGMKDSLQDTFTKHFELPAVSDPIERLVALNAEYAEHLWDEVPANSFVILTVLLAATGYVVYARRPEDWFPLSISLVGIGTVVAHPVISQSARLGSPLWFGVAFGLAMLIDRAVDGRRAGKKKRGVSLGQRPRS